jgi:type I restriction enzyme, S subunit
MINGWHVGKFGDVLEPVSRPVQVEPNKDYRNLGVQWYAKGLFVREEKPGHQIQAKELYQVALGDLVYNRLFAWKGSFAIAEDDTAGGFVSGEFPCFRVNTEKADLKFLHLYLSQEKIWQEIERISTGQTSISRLRLKEPVFLAMDIPLPPLMEQRRIVAHIESLAARVNEAQRLREEVAEDISAFVASYHVHYSDKVVKLGDILTLDEDKEIIKPEGSYPQIGVKGFGKGLFARETLSGAQTTYKWFNRLYYGAIVLSQVKGWEGAIGVVDKSLVGKFASPEYRTFRCKSDKALPEYLSEVFATSWFYLQLKTLSRGVGGRRERIRPELFVELEIPMPDIERQKLAVEIFAKFPALRELQVKSGEELSALMPSVLDRAFKGES